MSSGGSDSIPSSEGSVPWPIFLVGLWGASLKRNVSEADEGGTPAVCCDITQYSGHSFRIGAASTVAVVGIEDSLIKTVGRWESTAYLSYVRVPWDRLAGVSKQLSSL